MMAGRLQSWRTLQLLILLSLLGFTQPFEVREDEWEELSPDIAALHRLRGLSEHMFHERIERDTSGRRVRAERATGRVDDEENPKSWQQALQDSEALKEYADSFLADINKQKTDDWLLAASEISTSYSQKLLVMTDKEKSTQDRIQEEYSLDPHYSVIVSRECLFNESCLPEADGYTVVKIFGSVSQNGQTVSGLSGASLARLMLKPSLEEAPVFSIDGNTTAEFKHNFMRVFMVRSSHAVLETNHNSHYIYQVMDQPDSVSSYRIPQRPVDHTTQYDHQQILMLQDEPVVRKAAINLYEKHPSVSSVYVLDNNQKPKLIRGESVPLSEDSRLVLVGHGARDNGGEMRLAGYKPQDVAKIIQSTSRVGNKIKTTSIVGCEVGADKPFTTTLLKELHDTVGIQTEVHLREALLQVMHTGEKITLEISRDGLQWRHKDNSKKVVATLDRNGKLVIRNDPGSKGEAVFTNERNFLGPKRDKISRPNKQSDSYSQSPRLSGVRRAKDRYRITGVVHQDTKNRYRNCLDSLTSKPRDRFLKYRNNWPQEPKRFITSQVFERVDQNKVAQIKRACDELEGLSWGLFQSDARPNKVNVNNEQQIKDKYLIGHKDGYNMRWINDENQLKEILRKCYKIESGKDVRDVIRHYAKEGEDGATYLMVKDWIYVVNPENLYVYPVGKKLDNNQIGNVDKMNEVQKCITDQIGRERYNDIRGNMRGQNTNDPKESYAQYVKDVFRGERTISLQLSQEAWYTTYFTASVISESARNFRTFPLVLMALDLVGHNNNNIRQTGLDFLFEEHPMARGHSWIDPSQRGFSGSATPEDSSKLNNANPRTTEQLMDDLKTLITRESNMLEKWQKTVNNVPERMSEIGSEFRIFRDNLKTFFENLYKKFFHSVKATSLDQSDKATSLDSPDKATSLDSPDKATSLDHSDKATSLDHPDKATSLDNPDKATSLDSPDKATSLDNPDKATSLDQSDKATSLDSPDKATSLDSPDKATSLDNPDKATSLDQSDKATSLDSPDKATYLDSPDKATSLDSPDKATSLDSPDKAMSLDNPDKATSLDQSDKATSLDSPDKATSLDSSPDKATSLDNPDKATSLDQSDRAMSLDHSDKATSLDNPDKATSLDQSDRATSLDHSDKATSLDNPDKTTSLDQSDRATSLDHSDKATSLGSPDKATSLDHPDILNPSGHDGNHPASGTLGGYNDFDVTKKDLTLASELESSFKQESYFSRASAAFAEEIHVQLKARHQQLSGMHIKEGTARIEDGQFVWELVSKGADANKPVEFRAKLSPESQRYHEQMLKNMDKAVHDMELLSSKPSHQANKHVERTGTAVGALGLLLGMNGAVRAFEEGNIKAGVVGSLQTAHGLTTMTMSVIARQALSAETRIARAATAVMRSPAMKRTMVAIPIVGIGFGVYSLAEDLKRGDALGYIDAVLDGATIVLDVVELIQPELAPLIIPINLALSVVRMVTDDVYMAIQNELSSLPDGAGFLEKLGAVIVGFEKGILHFTIRVASVFYDWRYEEIEEGRRIVGSISDNRKYYTFIEQQDGTTAIDFSSGTSSWNGGGIYFCLADQGNSDFCMDYFVSDDEKMGKKCWPINTHGSKDIVLGLGESHWLKYKKLQRKVLMFIPAGSVSVVSGYEAVQNSRYGTYRGNRDSNHFFAVQKAKDHDTVELMLSYYYSLHGEEGDDVFFLGPQRSYVEGSGGKDTYIIPENGGKTIINNYDPSKALDTLHLSIDYSRISVSKSGEDVVLRYEGSHTVIIKNWFLGEAYRHMSMVSGDGVLFEISSTVVSSVQLVARGINKMFKTSGQVVNAGQPLLRSVTNIFGSPHNDVIHGNEGTNLIDGGGGQDHLFGGEGEDIYMVKDKKQSVVWIDNSSIDRKTDLAIIEAQFSTFKATVQDDDVLLTAVNDGKTINVILKNWFRSSADRHLFIVTKDLIKFTVSDNKTDCRWRNNCIQSLSIDYSSSPSALMVDLQENRAFDEVTEIRGSQFHDVIKGNKEHNVVIPGEGNDFIEGRGGEDWYIITPHQGVKTINNQSPDLALDVLFMKEQYRHLTCSCEGQSVIISVDGRRAVILQNWFSSKHHQHLQIKTSDGITAGLTANISSCGQSLLLPLSVNYRNQQPEPLWLEQHEFTHFFKGIKKDSSDLQCLQRHLQTCPSFYRECLSYLQSHRRHYQTCLPFDRECLSYLQSYQRHFQTCSSFHRTCESYLESHRRHFLTCPPCYRECLSFFQSTKRHLQTCSPFNRECLFFHESHLRRFDICSSFNRARYLGYTRFFFTILCSHQGKVMLMNDADSVKEMFGSSGFDVMVGNSNDNLLDPHTGGALMYGGEGKDTYIIKQGYGDQLLIHNFAEDQIIDTVQVDMDFLDGSRVVLNLRTPDLEVTVLTKGETFTFSLLSYSFGNQHQHVEFQSSDGVYFKVKSQNSTGDAPLFQIEAFKVTLQQSQADCRLDLSSYRNLSKVHTVQGCPSQSNNILGNHVDNALIGGWKDDALDGGEGDDTLIGGNGADILIGGTGDDTLYGEDGNDTLMGNSGWDVFIPGPGADLVDGGPGRDAVLYRGDHKTGQGVYVNLLTGQGRHADAEGDVLKDVETVIGTIYSDILVSGYESSLLKGSDGNDILVSTGEDYLVGGDGRDIYLLAFDHGSVTIDNCAEDNATDVVYLSSQSVPVFDCQNLSDRVLLTFSETNQTTIKVALRGWISDDNKCGHLVFAFRDVQKPVDTLLLECSDKTGGGLISPSTETP